MLDYKVVIDAGLVGSVLAEVDMFGFLVGMYERPIDSRLIVAVSSY